MEHSTGRRLGSSGKEVACMDEKTFSGNRVVLGCALFIAVSLGNVGVYMTSIAQLPGIYGVSITALGAIGMTMTLTAMVCSIFLIPIKNKLTSKGCLYLGGAAVFAHGWIVYLVHGQIMGLFVSLAVCGLLSGLAGYAVVNDIVARWFIEKRAAKTGLVLGAALFGMAFYQFLAGQLFARTDYYTAILGISLANAALMCLITRFLILAGAPEEVGQKPYGQMAASGNAAAVNAVRPDNAPSLGYNPAFWLLITASVLSAGNTNYVQSYATMFFTRCGMSIDLAAMVLSLMSACAGLFAFVSGRALERMKPAVFVLFTGGAVLGANLGMALYSHIPALPFIFLIVACYGVGATLATIMNLIGGYLFPPQQVTSVTAKCFAAYSGTNLVLQPISAAIVERWGFDILYLFVAGTCALGILCYLAAVFIAFRKEKQRKGETVSG